MGYNRVKITKDGQEAYCMPAAVRAWERNGWTRADDGSSGDANQPAAPPVAEAPPETPTRKAP